MSDLSKKRRSIAMVEGAVALILLADTTAPDEVNEWLSRAPREPEIIEVPNSRAAAFDDLLRGIGGFVKSLEFADTIGVSISRKVVRAQSPISRKVIRTKDPS